MMSISATITNVRAATVVHVLPRPVELRSWVIREREFFVVRVDSSEGYSGFGYGLTRSGPLAAIIRRVLTPAYAGADARRPADGFHAALRTNLPALASGIGMRALSVVDIAAWDLAAKLSGVPMAEYLGGQQMPLPATAVLGYPPAADRDEVAAQVRSRHAAGWTTYKLPAAPDPHLTLRRLAGVRDVAPESSLAIDYANMLSAVEEAVEVDRSLEEFRLGWLEDLVPPGDAGLVAAIRAQCRTPIAMGDEQGGSYYPEALLSAGAVDVLRVDATTNGGVTRLREIIGQATRAGVTVSPHMFPHVHYRIFAGLGVTTPIEWGLPDTGVHPMDDYLEQPEVVDGLMQPLASEPGFGELVNKDWLSRQQVDDPDGLFDD